MITTILDSLPGRALRIVTGGALALWGFAFGIPAALVIQSIGVTMAVLALADISLLRALGVGGRAAAPAPRERHA